MQNKRSISNVRAIEPSPHRRKQSFHTTTVRRSLNNGENVHLCVDNVMKICGRLWRTCKSEEMVRTPEQGVSNEKNRRRLCVIGSFIHRLMQSFQRLLKDFCKSFE